MESLVSVIIPVYNVEPYLERCLDSVINQTYRNLEIILVNDGSPDNCGKICDEYAQKDARIKVIHKENGGVSSARNAGLDIVRGEYIGFVDSDDYIDSDMYECLVHSAQKSGCDIVICGYHEVLGGTTREVSISEKEEVITSRQGIAGLIEDKSYRGYLWNRLYKKELFDGMRFPATIVMEDLSVNHLLFEKVDKIHLLNKELYYYIRREDSVTMKRRMKTNVALYRYHLKIYEEVIDDFKEYASVLNSRRIISAFDMLLSIDANDEKNEYTDVYNEAYCFLKNNRELIENSLLAEGYKKRVKLFLLSRNLFYFVSRIYNIIVYGKNTFEYL